MAKLRRAAAHLEKGLGHEGIEIANALIAETDRGCALVAAEFLSDSLERYLQRHMEKKQASPNNIRDFLTSLNAPLGNFSPRIKAAYWFDLIGPYTYSALENIKEIRNHCAHRAGPIEFTDKEVEPNVRSLEGYLHSRRQVGLDTDATAMIFLKADEFPVLDSYSAQRMVFLKAVSWVYFTLRVRVVNPIVPDGVVGTVFDVT